MGSRNPGSHFESSMSPRKAVASAGSGNSRENSKLGTARVTEKKTNFQLQDELRYAEECKEQVGNQSCRCEGKADDEANEKNCLSDELRTLKTRTFQDTKGKTKDKLCQQDVLPTLS